MLTVLAAKGDSLKEKQAINGKGGAVNKVEYTVTTSVSFSKKIIIIFVSRYIAIYRDI
jgi:hypothetical protein